MKKVLIIGAGEAGRMVAAELARGPELQLQLDCWLDDNRSLHGVELLGCPILGGTEDLPRHALERKIDEVIIAIPSAEGRQVRRLVKICQEAGLPFKIVPGIREIVTGSVQISQIRQVNPQDLLGRELVDFHSDHVQKQLMGKRVLITGAGGSIGSEIARLIAPLGLSQLILMGRGENSIFEIENELREKHPSLNILPLIADMRDTVRLTVLAEALKPDIVYHAAAHKHVHYMEAWPTEAFTNTVLGTRNMIDFCRRAGTERMVMLSTDKAVDPCGVMGASKRLTELLLLAANRESGECRFISVRFGNVLGSRGSVVPLFQRQIQNGGPVTVTDPEVTRYFMTIKEASMLVIEAGSTGQGGEIFILNMGESVGILELAKSMIRLSGLEPEIDIPIQFTGLRPGEKMHEKLMTREEAEVSEFGDQLMIIHPSLPEGLNVDEILIRLGQLAGGDQDQLLCDQMLTIAREVKDLL
jgi:FlaA1/EpsC-like NDP-sugar epimerase